MTPTKPAIIARSTFVLRLVDGVFVKRVGTRLSVAWSYCDSTEPYPSTGLIIDPHKLVQCERLWLAFVQDHILATDQNFTPF